MNNLPKAIQDLLPLNQPCNYLVLPTGEWVVCLKRISEEGQQESGYNVVRIVGDTTFQSGTAWYPDSIDVRDAIAPLKKSLAAKVKVA